AVQTCRDFVDVLVEFGARADAGEDDLQGGTLFLRVFLHGNPPAIVGNAGAAVHVDLDVDVLTITGQGFVDAIVNQLVHQVMQAIDADVADVDAGSAPDVRSVAQHLNVFLVVFGFSYGGVASCGFDRWIQGFFGHLRVLP